jgi:hypothetical protein
VSEAAKPDDDEAVLIWRSSLRSTPGWSSAITRVAALSFDGAMCAHDICAHYAALEEIVCEELPDSDERDRLLERLAGLEAAALIACGELKVH